ncbi:extracellular solute-binding protein [Candidatus Gracilibacteria bacterium]|nr:extracellular solute-binding protein [Candidatus Gracilibacteria bacterium]
MITAVAYVSRQKTTTNTVPKSLKIWITDGTSDAYKPLIEGFKKYAPEYNKTDIIVEKQTNDADRYRTLILSTLTEGSGPDIFMLHSGEDAILETKIEPIPSNILDFSDFDKRYDDIFQGLVSSTGSGKNKISTLKGVPLSYETLGVFYNKSLIREIPKTWNELESLYRDSSSGKYPSNLGLGPTYTPNMGDILPLWLIDAGATSYSDLSTGKNGLSAYLSYGDIKIPSSQSEPADVSIVDTLRGEQPNMISTKNNTIDMFIRGNIAMIIGYPSLILDLEKANKRAGSASASSVILTGRIPKTISQSVINIGKYTYFGVSKLSEKGQLSAKFLQYLMTPEAQRLYMSAYPYLIPAQSEFYASIENISLSDTLTRAKIGPFIPNIGDQLSLFQYGLKSRFDRYLSEGIDTTSTPDIESITSKISKDIDCEIKISIGGEQAGDCRDQ